MKGKVSKLFLLLSLCGWSVGVVASEAVSANTAPSAKQEWVASMQRDLPPVLCQSDHYFMQCFQVTPEECQSSMALYVKACVDNIVIALPEQIGAEQGEHWGKMVGRCSYDLFEKFMKEKKSSDPKCQETTQPPAPAAQGGSQ